MLQAQTKQLCESTKSHRQIKPKKVDGCLVRRFREGGLKTLAHDGVTPYGPYQGREPTVRP